ncbi:MAG: ATP-binding protein [Myxococcales bacterium]|nr:ATP-binding protein [Myxococcales bacterium]
MRATHNQPDAAESVGSCAMRHRRDRGATGFEPRRRRGRSKLSTEERAYRDARRRAKRKFGFVWHFVAYALVCVFLLFVAGIRPAFIVALAWGIGIGCHYFAAVLAPDLRRRFIEQEVSRQVVHDVSRERRELEDKHVASLEELSASIAHEIRNPITAAKSLVQQMGEDLESSENIGYAKVALDELDRVERSISHLLRFARDEELHVRDLRLVEVVESALETFRDRLGRDGVVVERDLATDGAMRGDPEKLRRVLINLVSNALDAIEAAGTPDPRIQVVAGENLAGTEVWVRVRDNGPGIDPDTLHKIFSPFYTSKEKGTGLGLAISKKVVDAHGGSLEAHSEPGAGADFLLTFPKQQPDGRARS